MTTLLSLDPGAEHTGWAIVDVDTKTCPISGTLPTWHGLDALFTIHAPDIVVYEEFRLYPAMAKAKSFGTLSEIETIGVLKYLCEEYKVPIVAQKASCKEHVALPRQVAGVRGPHARDALKHALYYIERTRQ